MLVDFGLYANHYTSDMTRLFYYGNVPHELQRRAAEMLKLVNALIPLCTPQRKIADIQKVADETTKSLGFGLKLAHTFGHGVGLEVHEAPFVANNPTLEEGMIVTIEPGFYQEGLGGVRIEEMVLVAEKPELLTSKLPQDVIVVDFYN